MFSDWDTSSDDEPEFSNVDGKGPRQASAIGGDEGPVVLWRKYSPADLFPTAKDPSCKPDWPLAAYWPVFVGNFRVESWVEDNWPTQVSNYFAYRGFLTRMIVFPRNPSGEFADYLKQNLLIDMLVYFTSKEDAARAVTICHLDFYYGFKLNVLPGRTRLFYDNSKSIRFENVGSELLQEHHIAKYLNRYSVINFAARYSISDVIVQFISVQAMLDALQNQYRWKPKELTKQTMKQRFVEADVIPDIERAMKEKVGFMVMQPSADVLAQLYKGIRPIVDNRWTVHRNPMKAPAAKLIAKQFKKGNRWRRTPGRAISKPKMEKANVQAANEILKKYNLGPITKLEIWTKHRQQNRENMAKRMQEKQKQQQTKSMHMLQYWRESNKARRIETGPVHSSGSQDSNMKTKRSDGRSRLHSKAWSKAQKLKKAKSKLAQKPNHEAMKFKREAESNGSPGNSKPDVKPFEGSPPTPPPPPTINAADREYLNNQGLPPKAEPLDMLLPDSGGHSGKNRVFGTAQGERLQAMGGEDKSSLNSRNRRQETMPHDRQYSDGGGQYGVKRAFGSQHGSRNRSPENARQYPERAINFYPGDVTSTKATSILVSRNRSPERIPHVRTLPDRGGHNEERVFAEGIKAVGSEAASSRVSTNRSHEAMPYDELYSDRERRYGENVIHSCHDSRNRSPGTLSYERQHPEIRGQPVEDRTFRFCQDGEMNAISREEAADSGGSRNRSREAMSYDRQYPDRGERNEEQTYASRQGNEMNTVNRAAEIGRGYANRNPEEIPLDTSLLDRRELHREGRIFDSMNAISKEFADSRALRNHRPEVMAYEREHIGGHYRDNEAVSSGQRGEMNIGNREASSRRNSRNRSPESMSCERRQPVRERRYGDRSPDATPHDRHLPDRGGYHRDNIGGRGTRNLSPSTMTYERQLLETRVHYGDRRQEVMSYDRQHLDRERRSDNVGAFGSQQGTAMRLIISNEVTINRNPRHRSPEVNSYDRQSPGRGDRYENRSPEETHYDRQHPGGDYEERIAFESRRGSEMRVITNEVVINRDSRNYVPEVMPYDERNTDRERRYEDMRAFGSQQGSERRIISNEVATSRDSRNYNPEQVPYDRQPSSREDRYGNRSPEAIPYARQHPDIRGHYEEMHAFDSRRGSEMNVVRDLRNRSPGAMSYDRQHLDREDHHGDNRAVDSFPDATNRDSGNRSLEAMLYDRERRERHEEERRALAFRQHSRNRSPEAILYESQRPDRAENYGESRALDSRRDARNRSPEVLPHVRQHSDRREYHRDRSPHVAPFGRRHPDEGRRYGESRASGSRQDSRSRSPGARLYDRQQRARDSRRDREVNVVVRQDTSSRRERSDHRKHPADRPREHGERTLASRKEDGSMKNPRPDHSNMECRFCGQMGHIRKTCSKLKHLTRDSVRK